MAYFFPQPPNFTLGPPPAPPWIRYDFSCADGEVLLHIDSRDVSTVPANNDELSSGHSGSKTVSILGVLIGVLALVLTILVIAFYVYKRKLIKYDVQHKDIGSEHLANGVGRKATQSINPSEIKPPDEGKDFQPYCNVVIPNKQKESFPQEESPCYATIGHNSTTTSGVSSESFDFSHLPFSVHVPIVNDVKPVIQPDIVADATIQVQRNIVLFDGDGDEIFTPSLPHPSLSKYTERSKFSEKNNRVQSNRRLSDAGGRRRKKKRYPGQQQRSSLSLYPQSYGTMDGFSAFGSRINPEMNDIPFAYEDPYLRGSFNPVPSFENSLSSRMSDNSSHMVAPYRHSRSRPPRMGVQSMRSSSFSSCTFDRDD